LPDLTRGLYGSSVGGNMVRADAAEMIGTFVLTLAGTSVAVAALTDRPVGAPPDLLAVALAFGLVLVALVSALGHVSGAHLNPAVTLALAASGRFGWRYVPGYVVAQLVGACAAALVVRVTYGGAADSRAALGAPSPADGTGHWQALVIEVVITFILMLVIVSVATDDRVPPAAVGPAVGFALAAAVLIGGPVSGGAANPARALGPMIVAFQFPSWPVYIVGPILGATLAALLYTRFLAEADATVTTEA
jgi:MIP family channel proteins